MTAHPERVLLPKGTACLLTIIVSAIYFFMPAAQLSAQYSTDKQYESIIYREKQAAILEYLADDMMRGRETGSRGCQHAGWYIRSEFIRYGLKPFDSVFTQSFRPEIRTKTESGTKTETGTKTGRNIIGLVPSVVPSDEYIIVSAHYDHIGSINGYIYNGADDNASGVTAMLNLAEMFSTLRKAGIAPRRNIIFAAFDAKEMNLAGSKAFVASLEDKGLCSDKIKCAINIDQIGSILVPPHKDTNYVLVLGTETYKKSDLKKALGYRNSFYDIYLDIDHTFYGSRSFYDSYYRLSDQYPFAEKGIPAILFTSGFHEKTYKEDDEKDIISYPILKRRTALIFHLIKYLTE